jgi:acyl carrier protein
VNDEDAAMAIVDEVRQIIAQTLRVPIEQLTPETRLDDIGAASLDVIEIVFELEEKFGISIPFNPDEGSPSGRGAQEPNEAGDLASQTIGEVARAVKSLVDAKKQAS